jgi:Protein of unknown function (DUF3551)
MEVNMRLLFALSALLVVATTGPSMARDYPYCARTVMNDWGDCSFTSYRQCMATVSGQRGECILNPKLAFEQNRRGARRASGWQNDNRW